MGSFTKTERSERATSSSSLVLPEKRLYAIPAAMPAPADSPQRCTFSMSYLYVFARSLDRTRYRNASMQSCQPAGNGSSGARRWSSIVQTKEGEVPVVLISTIHSAKKGSSACPRTYPPPCTVKTSGSGSTGSESGTPISSRPSPPSDRGYLISVVLKCFLCPSKPSLFILSSFARTDLHPSALSTIDSRPMTPPITTWRSRSTKVMFGLPQMPGGPSPLV
mmetsp:Transcript_6585/g.11453  ORF Transcript_6585/g.11453 Transcript_6585/m.11453 type:complete len:221 (+) Transcript_6585:426-1088(+)